MTQKDIKEYHEAVRNLESLVKLPRKYDYMSDHSNPEVFLKRMAYFLNLLGNPQKDFKYVHVSGTAGKGTVSTMIHEMLVRSGKKSGLITSPFVTTTIDKTKVGDKYISPKDFVRIFKYIKPMLDQAYEKSPYGGPSYFETLLGISLIYFQEQKCEWLVFEVGCGGRYDYTNVTGPGTISVITNIGNDHAHLIGPTLKDIAYEKAGIIKKNGVFFTTEKRPSLRKVFSEECKKQKAQCEFLDVDGSYREANRILVTAVANKISVDPKYITDVTLPCRFEIVSKNPLVVLDGAHNADKIVTTVENLKKLKYRKCIVVFAVAENKDAKNMVHKLAPYVSEFVMTRATTSFRMMTDPKNLVSMARKIKTPARMFLDPRDALEYAQERATKNDCILVTGSFFVAGELRELWYPEEYVLDNRKSF